MIIQRLACVAWHDKWGLCVSHGVRLPAWWIIFLLMLSSWLILPGCELRSGLGKSILLIPENRPPIPVGPPNKFGTSQDIRPWKESRVERLTGRFVQLGSAVSSGVVVRWRSRTIRCAGEDLGLARWCQGQAACCPQIPCRSTATSRAETLNNGSAISFVSSRRPTSRTPLSHPFKAKSVSELRRPSTSTR